MAKRGRKPELTKQLTEMLDGFSRYLLHLERRVEALEARTPRRRRRRNRKTERPVGSQPKGRSAKGMTGPPKVSKSSKTKPTSKVAA